MSFEIKDAVIHGVKKASESNEAEAKLKDRCFDCTDPILNSFTAELLKAFSTEVNTWGDISPPDQNIFHQHLIKWQLPEDAAAPTPFLGFSEQTVDKIVEEIKDSYQATGGYVLFIRYLSRNEFFLLVVMLKLETTYGIDEDDMSFYETQSFSMRNFHEAARLNLSTWSARHSEQLNQDIDEAEYEDSIRCFSFIKKRGTNEDITKYLRRALGCINFAESTANTVNLIRAVDDFCTSKNLSSEVRQEKRTQLHDYLSHKIDSKEPASLRDVTALLSSTNENEEENELLQFIKNNGYKVDETFKPNPTKVKGLARVSGKIGDTSINFPISDLDLNVFYDSATRELTLTNVPDAMDKKIKKAKGG